MTASSPTTLRRYFGTWSLIAIGLNTVVGGGFFLLPGIFFGHVGAWTPWLIVLVGLCLVPIGLCFAEVASRFDGTGGPYLYTREAFGRFAGFQMSWLIWITRLVAHASVLSALMAGVAYVAPALSAEPYRTLIICGVTGTVAFFNIIGTREAAWFLNGVTVVKFTPILLFASVGLLYIDTSNFAAPGPPPIKEVSTAALLMVFALSGFEMLTIPAGEASGPTRQVPRAIVTVIAATTLMMVLANVVTIGLLDRPDNSSMPIADAAAVMWGAGGAIAISLAIIVSATGHNMSSLIVASRILYSMGEKGDVPAFLGKLNPRLRTPVNAVGVTALAISLLAVTNSYETLASVTAMTRLLIYAGVAAATLRLRHPSLARHISAPRYIPPLSRLMPWLAIMASLLILLGITEETVLVGGGVLLVGFAVFFARTLRSPVQETDA